MFLINGRSLQIYYSTDVKTKTLEVFLDFQSLDEVI